MFAWEAQPDFMALVRDDMTHWITRKNEIMHSLLTRGKNTADKEQLMYAAAYLISIGDPLGNTLAKLASA